ncbi:assimilatory nitrate reductase catalytic subunit/cobaltochelatase CobN [Sinorhizobium kostiense]|uniref:Assimilatory nitrate reductase catalytic subunit/cobaltochelatase CobN n=1 Tax=Sinorhizobium kostiense TaxID=76747 RepID=A0ABS4R3W3_9HYPH|nr:assimilatory nitrate reductase catalytic subunit/cobaltochelatase CobN [Sinorhizobium kostiense]
MMDAAYTPLWPAGHLPHKGGERIWHGPRAHRGVPRAQAFPLERTARRESISPLVGEMAGRPEGGTPVASALKFSQEA